MKKQKRHKKVLAPRSIRRMFPNVKFVVDAKTSIELDVEPGDCNNAEPLNARECALARAAKREYNADAAVIGLSSSYVIKGDTATRYATGQAVSREIVSFDRHSDFEPGTYVLVPKSPSERFGNRSSGAKGSHTSKRVIHKLARVRAFK